MTASRSTNSGAASHPDPDGRKGYPAGSFPRALISETGPLTERLRVREIGDDEGRRLVRIRSCGSGSA
jgi:hypothetical protein